MRWFFGSRKERAGKGGRDSAHHRQQPGRASARKARKKYRRQPSPLTWSDPDQDFITRYGDPFDG